MKVHHLIVTAIGIILLALAACSGGDSNPTGSNGGGGGGGGGGNSSVSFATAIQPILLDRCAIPNCHGSGTIQSGLNMGTASYATVTSIAGFSGTQFINPGNANASTFYLKTKNPPAFGARMPKNGPPYLTDTQIQNIQTWINDGAPNN